MKLFHQRVSHATYADLFDKHVKMNGELNEARGLFGLLVHHLTGGDGEISFAFERPDLPALEVAVYEAQGKITIRMRPVNKASE